MSPIEVIQKAICCPSGNCYAIEYNFKYPQKHQNPCMSHTKEPEAIAALLALSKMHPTAEMLSAAYEANNYQNDDMDNILIWEAMLDAAVKEGNNDKSE